MKRYFLSAAFLAGALSPVVAADLAPVESPPAISAPAAFDWNGFYLGGNVGGGRADVDWTYQPFGETAHHDGKGFLGGVQAGYNWQIDGFVIGAEADFLGSSIDGDTPCPNPAYSCTSDTKWLSTVRARAGYSFDNLLVYATGGLGIGRFEIKTDDGAGTSGSTIRNDTGWVAGAGVEYGFSPNWSIKAEYMHHDFGERTYTVDGGNPVDADFRFDTGKIGVNYRF
ncbi:outer membrane beta-barrel protein [Sinorhizobium medicae]|uniref:Porin n=2 Tax=Sinorhizobium medicae TaxID=110321 RepID=A0A508X4K8_9HYPH|nr:outer membrane protein [Sinorhizobium medicae]ABR59276.1 porin [Sinorhizobium medicae WSM419]MBO1939336.1 porin family protein [Sinorhizobium medicae]MBO1963438.1 porin family protein [Sinorhizobium medicae]MDX0403899.1 outer membrane beta-barrel protein [Sinorhizobium medicae]MDX0409759.1 outer membrane beta-barrel protein [Sinorhizobium medicae]